MENAKAIKWALKYFEILSGLSVNFGKCCVMGLNMAEQEVSELTELFGCQRGVLPLKYLGVLVGGGLNRVVNWGGLVDKMKLKLRDWDGKGVSLGGRVTLIRSVLSAIPTYRMSFAPIPASTVGAFRSTQSNFLWGGETGGNKKLAWVRWDTLCRSKRDGGLGIKNLGWFNVALLGKWCWRFLHEKDSLWTKVIRSRHAKVGFGETGSFGGISFGRGVGWWSRVVTAVQGKYGNWFFSNLSKVIGDGRHTRFWKDKWRGDQTLKDKFPRLYHLTEHKEAMVGEMGLWSDDIWEWRLRWRRRLSDGEREVAERLEKEIEGAKLEPNSPDKWKWGEEPIYTVKKAYESIAKKMEKQERIHIQADLFKWIWNSTAPFKHQVMMWRAIRDRLPTRANLLHRQIIRMEDANCPCCQETVETTCHLFVRCARVEMLWNKIISWVGVVWSAPDKLSDHLECFSHLLKGKKVRKRLVGLWNCVVWVIWRWRNSFIFENRPWDFAGMEEEIKRRFWGWSVAKGDLDANGGYLEWSRNELCKVWNV